MIRKKIFSKEAKKSHDLNQHYKKVFQTIKFQNESKKKEDDCYKF